jgi:hypothetical protein
MMIRRTIQLEDGTAAWLLISQVEHARISGELTRVWCDPFEDEIVEAITHHDDGWAKWEAAPQMDAERGRPLSFLEMPMDEALRIWSDSIAAARHIGPLAGAIVAGHFLGLAGGSDQAKRPLPARWLRDMAGTRAGWLLEWQQQSTNHTPEVAERGQRMLLTADLLSLWLCCDGPVTSVDAGETPNAEMKSRTATVLGMYHFTEASKAVERDAIVWEGTLAPWPFSMAELQLATPAIAAPAQKYPSWAALKAASWPVDVRWRLRQTLPTSGEC